MNQRELVTKVPAHRQESSSSINPVIATAPGSAASMLALQRVVGNRGIQLLLQRRGGATIASDRAISESLDDRSSGRPLDADLRADFETRFGTPLQAVSIHSDSRAANLTAGLGANAFTMGSDIYFAADAARFDTHDGRLLLAHELAHVVQGQSFPGSATELVSKPGDTAEINADRSAEEALSRRQITARAAPDAVLQRQGTTVRQPTANATATGAVAQPVFWGLDISVRPFASYASIGAPGHALTEIADYMYGTPEAAADLQSKNGPLPDQLRPGMVLKPTGQPLTARASGDLNAAIKSGTILRTQGTESQESTALYTFSVNGQQCTYTEPQYMALLQGMATFVRIQATYVNGMATDGRAIHSQFKEENDWSAVRWTSDLLGGVRIPDPSETWDALISDSETLVKRFTNSYVPDLNSRAEIAGAGAQLFGLNDRLAVAQSIWHDYITGTIKGAERSVKALEFTRNTSFAIVAGTAGAVAAPAVFAAIGATTVAGTVGATAVAVGTGAAAGGVIRGGLEVAAPGATQGSTWDRFKGGFETGAVQGALGAATAFVAPSVAGAISQHAFGVAPQALGTGGRIAVNAMTGVAIGAPVGAGSAAVSNLGAYRRGEIGGWDYLESIGLGGVEGGVGGGVGGAVFGALPVKGLYRQGGKLFTGEPVTPKWMEAGPFAPKAALKEPTGPSFADISEESWGNPATLARHFADHGADFGATSAGEYAAQASRFLQRSQAEGLPTKIDRFGTIRTYDPATNEFGSFNANGTTRTYYAPDPASHGLPTNWDYWLSQPGADPWKL